MKSNKFVIEQLGRDYGYLKEIEAELRTRSTHLSEVIGDGDPEPALAQCAKHLCEVADFIDDLFYADHDYNPSVYIEEAEK
tara:strand:+ start:294 stop:536 length:243 start_codon:yes stop_codon:yes gene_type:complete